MKVHRTALIAIILVITLTGILQAVIPTPDLSEWAVEPVAVGVNTIYMQATEGQAGSNIQYNFDCDVNTFDSGWQDSTIYYRGDFAAGATYQFQLTSRDLSDNTDYFSTAVVVTLPSVLPLPYPSPAQWKAAPRKLSNNRIGMEAATGYTEGQFVSGQWVSSPVEYKFICTNSTDPSFPAAILTRDWSTNPVYNPVVSVVTSPGYQYTFQVQIRPASDSSLETDPVGTDRTVSMAPAPIIREVPTPTYPTIQSAIDSSNHGDTVLVHPGVYRETNIDFQGKAITVRSENPEDPSIVAATVVDCNDIWDFGSVFHETRRAFVFGSGEGRDSVLAGLTIKNAVAVDDADVRLIPGPIGVSSRRDPVFYDGRDAAGGAILIGSVEFGDFKEISSSADPGSPTIRNCVFENCSANGRYGFHGTDAPVIDIGPGLDGGRGGNGGNAFGGAIYAVAGSAPLIKECQFTNCRAIGGSAGNGSNGSDAGGHPDGVENAPGYRGGDGGDAGLGGCAWGGAVYFEQDCAPELYDVTVEDCFVQVGEAGYAGNGANGGDAVGIGDGGKGGNGGIGGDLRAPNSYAGAVYYGQNNDVLIDSCVFTNCRVVAELRGAERRDGDGVIIGYDYNGGDGGDGGGNSGDPGTRGGTGGHGGPAFFVPDKMTAIGGVEATGGTGGDGGGDNGVGGNGGFRLGEGGSPGGLTFSLIPQQLGIFPSNMYYMSYYWEDTTNLDTNNPPSSLNDFIEKPFSFPWESLDIDEAEVGPDDHIIEPDPENQEVPGSALAMIPFTDIFDSEFTPFYGFANGIAEVEVLVFLIEPADPDADPPTDNVYAYVIGDPTVVSATVTDVNDLTPTDPAFPNSGACAGANYYGDNSTITMKDTTVSENNSFANHAGGELYDRGCAASFDNCVFENNRTLYEMTDDPLDPDVDPSIESDRDTNTDYRLEGYGGAIFADQPTEFEFFNDCRFTNNNAYAGGAVYCNFEPSGLDGDPYSQSLDLEDCEFSGNLADYHFINSYGGGVYAGNTFDAYEEFYFNDFIDIVQFETSQYIDHGEITFQHIIDTDLWSDELEADHILWGLNSPWYDVSVTNCVFTDCNSPFGGGLLIDSSIVDLVDSEFLGNNGEIGVGGFLYASDVWVEDNLFDQNISTDFVSRGFLSEQDNSTVNIVGSGAGLYIGASDIWLTKNRFTANQTNGYGAGLYINGAPLAVYPQSVINNLFSDNSADLAGGALVAEGGSDMDVTNCTFAENMVTDASFGYAGALLAHDTFVNITNTIFWHNLASFGSQIVVGDPFEFEQPYDPFYIPYSTVFVDYSDVDGGVTELFVSDGELPWAWYGANNIETDPLFVVVSEPVEKFYLSQFPVQGVKSPCVDTGDGTADELNAALSFVGTTRTDLAGDIDTVDMGYHYTSVETEFCAYADLVLDGIVNLDDLVVLAVNWLGQCNPANSWCSGSDLNFDSDVDLFDYAYLAGCWQVFDDQPPSPDPAQWKVVPAPVENTIDSITMEAVEATDNWRIVGVEYYFFNLTDPAHDSGWRQSYDPGRLDYVPEPWIYVDSGLQEGVSYTYTVVTRDILGIETAASTPESAVAGIVDPDPPTPDPSEWAVEPIQTTLDSIAMEAVQAVDDNGVEYFFDCDDDAFDSGWQQNADAGDPGFVATPWVYEASGYALAQTYTFSVRTRDRSLAQNETLPSVEVGVTTIVPQAQWDQLPTQSATSQSVTMSAEPAGSLGSGFVIQYEFAELGGAAGGNGRAYGTSRTFTDSGLEAGQTYSYQVRIGVFSGTTLISEGEWSDVAAVVVAEVDQTPPDPDPAEHLATTPVASLEDFEWWHTVVAVVATDVSGVEYSFVCSEPSLSSGSSGNGPLWRNADNVGLGADADPDDVFYPNPNSIGLFQVPEEYHVITFTKRADLTWTIKTRDRSPNANATADSVPKAIVNP